MSKAKVTDLRKAYPDLTPDKNYPPLKFKSLKGKVSAGVRRAYGLLEWPAMRRLADRVDPSYRN
jgi:hypothetical protein